LRDEALHQHRYIVRNWQHQRAILSLSN
ncbi:hypothetical protein D046_0108B, partial [Vibrio parahaemolyticus V-223/04]